MFGKVITLVINLLSAIQWIEKDDELQRKILEIVRDQIDLVLAPPPKIDVVRFLYENEGKISAIKRWRELHDGMGLKDAKDQVEEGASKEEWKDYRVGKRATIQCPESDYDKENCTISRIVPSGFYVKFAHIRHEIFFHHSAVHVQM